MNPLRLAILLAPLLTPLARGHAQNDPRPVDRVISGREVLELIEPYVEMSRREFPAVRERFLEGLPDGKTLFVSVPITDKEEGAVEQVFVQVETIAGDRIAGKIASNLRSIKNYKKGDDFECTTDEIKDWTITSPDGSEEGNYVGKFIDVLKDGIVPLVLEVNIDRDGTVTSATFAQAFNRFEQDVSYCIPDSAKKKAESLILEKTYEPQEKASTIYTFVIYNYHEDQVSLRVESEKGSEE